MAMVADLEFTKGGAKVHKFFIAGVKMRKRKCRITKLEKKVSNFDKFLLKNFREGGRLPLLVPPSLRHSMENLVQTALNDLDLIRRDFPEWESHGIGEVKGVFGFVKTLYLIASKWGGFTLDTMEETIQTQCERIKEFLDVLLSMSPYDQDRFEEEWYNWHGEEVLEFLIDVRGSIIWDLGEILHVDESSESGSSSPMETQRGPLFALKSGFSSPMETEELLRMTDSLLGNLQDILQSKPAINLGGIDDLEESMRFLKNFIRFAESRGLVHDEMRDLLIHVQGLLVDVVLFTFEVWEAVCTVDGLPDVSPLMESIEPVNFHVCQIYFSVLKKASKCSVSSSHPTQESHTRILEDFIDSLIFLLLKILIRGMSGVYNFEHQTHKLYAGLRSLRTTLREHHGTPFDEPYQKLHDLIGQVICKAGLITFCLFLEKKEIEFVENVELLFIDFEEMYRFIDVVEEKAPRMSASYSPQMINMTEITTLKTEASESSHSMGQITQVQNVTKAQRTMPAGGKISEFNEPMVGLDDEFTKIIDTLISGNKSLQIVSLVGMAGLGKTTLAKRIYRDPSISYYFQFCSWGTVSQSYNSRSLLIEILSGTCQPSELNKLDNFQLADKLRRSLKGRKYFIILDDVWDTKAWSSLQLSFPDEKMGSRILLTSRYRHVGSQCGPKNLTYELRNLTPDESWQLLRMKIQKHTSSDLLERGKVIADHCNGLPLMILIVAGLLSTTESGIWDEVEDNLKKVITPARDQFKETLDLSYRHLPDHLKPCFLYLGAFKDDEEIPVQELLWLWIAEGFVKKAGRELENVAQGYMEELIHRNLVMVAKSRGKVKSCVLHDLLHDFCKKKCKEEHFLHHIQGREPGNPIEPGVLRRLLHVYFGGVEDFQESRMLFPRLRTLFLRSDHYRFGDAIARPLYGILYDFSQSKLLRVLDLRRSCEFISFPRVILSLVLLRFLALAGEGSIILPSSIDKLSILETLIFTRGGIVHLPYSMWKMKNLRHLCTSRGSSWILPTRNHIIHSNLGSVQTLSWLRSAPGQLLRKALGKFPNISKFSCDLNLDKVRTGDLNVELDFLSRLESLKIYNVYSEKRDLQFQLPQALKELTLSNLHLQWRRISAIGRLPRLEFLKLRFDAFIGEKWDMEAEEEEEVRFPQLRFLKLSYMEKLVEWRGSDDHFPCLEKLVLYNCSKLKELPSCLEESSTLEVIEVSECSRHVDDSVRKLKESLNDNGNEGVKILIHPPLYEAEGTEASEDETE